MKSELVAYAIAAGALLDGINSRLRLRREARRREAEAEERRAAVSRALGVNTVTVDGLEMPAPDYDHWTQKSTELKDGKEVTLVCVGKVHVSNEGTIWIGVGTPPLPVTPGTKQYAADVWKAHRQRVISQSLKQE